MHMVLDQDRPSTVASFCGFWPALNYNESQAHPNHDQTFKWHQHIISILWMRPNFAGIPHNLYCPLQAHCLLKYYFMLRKLKTCVCSMPRNATINLTTNIIRSDPRTCKFGSFPSWGIFPPMWNWSNINWTTDHLWRLAPQTWLRSHGFWTIEKSKLTINVHILRERSLQSLIHACRIQLACYLIPSLSR